MANVSYRPFRKVIAISEAIADVLREHGMSTDERVAVIRSAVDIDAFAGNAGLRFVSRAEFGIVQRRLRLSRRRAN